MAHPPYLREKARELRIRNKMSLDEIAECLALGKTTVWYWIRDLPDPAIKRFKALRDAAYQRGLEEFDQLDAEPGFRDFVCMYMPGRFRLQRKSNSGKLAGRKWRSRHGVLTVGANDTQLRARLQACIDLVRRSWLHSPSGV